LQNISTKSSAHADINVLAQRYAGDWDPENAMSEMEDILVKFPKQIDILFSEGDAMALGCLNAAKSAGEKFLVGSIDGQLEAIEALMDGEITAIGVNSAVLTGKTGAEKALAAVRGEPVQPRIYVPSPTITKDNVEEHYKPGVPFL
jgi:ribose transport system substrate-binding protein